jgi:hypothetical protein
MRILRIIFACAILALVASCVSSTPQVQPASTSPQDVIVTAPSPLLELKTLHRSRLRITGSEEYDEAFANAIDSNWLRLLDSNRSLGSPNLGTVVLEFNLHSDGQVTEMKVVRSNVGDWQTDMCKEAVLMGVPYAHWTDALLKALKTNSCDVQFNFDYEK